MGRFLLNSEYVNKDHGTEALKKFVNIVYSEVGITHIELTVSDQNKQAYRCYEKAGFVPTGKTAVRNDGSVSVWMDIKHEANQNLSL